MPRIGCRILSIVAEAIGTFTIVNERGMHARPWGRFVRLAATFKSEVTVENSEGVRNGKSVLGLLLLVASKGTDVTIKTVGPDAEECLKKLGELVSSHFPEG